MRKRLTNDGTSATGTVASPPAPQSDPDPPPPPVVEDDADDDADEGEGEGEDQPATSRGIFGRRRVEDDGGEGND